MGLGFISKHPFVTPFVGVWIETNKASPQMVLRSVTPFVGVWIETGGGKGLPVPLFVTPFVGVWIET